MRRSFHSEWDSWRQVPREADREAALLDERERSHFCNHHPVLSPGLRERSPVFVSWNGSDG